MLFHPYLIFTSILQMCSIISAIYKTSLERVSCAHESICWGGKNICCKFCNCATGKQRGSGNSGNTREPSSGRRRAPSTTSRCPLVGACQALAKIFANFTPLPPSRKYMKCGSSSQQFGSHLPLQVQYDARRGAFNGSSRVHNPQNS